MSEYSESKEREIKEVITKWTKDFTQDERYKTLTETQKEEAEFVIGVFADYMYGYFLQEPSQWTESALEECCLDILPRKVSAGSTFYKSVEPVLTAFLQFLQDTGRVRRAGGLISSLKKVSGRMIKNAENPKNWGWAKQFVMGAMDAGVDVGDQEELERYVQKINQGIIKSPTEKVKVRRNDPCPCGSGKKYKKCCGAGE